MSQSLTPVTYPEVTTVRWSSDASDDRFTVENPATGEVITKVQTVTVFDTEDEAIDIANESEYGLLAGVYSGDQARAMRVARRLENGMVLVNNYNREVLGDPFGGVKHSGYGREHTLATLQDFGQPKMIRIPSGLGAIPYWRAVNEIYGESGSEVVANV